jgi:hypothetical protein
VRYFLLILQHYLHRFQYCEDQASESCAMNAPSSHNHCRKRYETPASAHSGFETVLIESEMYSA